jgi:hypothetical protein
MRNDRLSAPAFVYPVPPVQRLSLAAILLLGFLGLCVPISARAADVVAYPVASIYIPATSWTITGKGADNTIVSISARAYEPQGDGTLTNGCYYCHCAINGSTQFVVDAGQTITSWKISPTSYGYNPGGANAATASGTKLTFTMPSTQYVEIQINSKAVLCLLADPFETNAPNPNDPGVYNVTVSPYNANTTGTADDTNAINAAITAANSYASVHGGTGIVYFPQGIYLTSPVTLKSNVALYFAGGSVLYANTAFGWVTSPPSNWLIKTSSGNSNMEVYGRGEIDCRGSEISNNPSVNGGAQIGPIKLDTVSGVQIYGVVVTDSSEFTIHPSQQCTNITVANVKIINRYNWLWNDGMDFTDSYGSTTTPCTVTHCFIRTCDDATTVKTGYSGTAHTSHDITYSDMVVDSGQGCGFCVGAETSVDIYNITAEKYNVIECNRALALLHRNGPGKWHDMTFKTWTVDDVDKGTDTWNSDNRPPLLSGSYHEAIEMEVYDDANNDGVGPIYNILCQDMTFLKHGPTASYLWGYSATDNISAVTFNNLVIEGVQILSFTTPVGPSPSQPAIRNMANTSNITFNASP